MVLLVLLHGSLVSIVSVFSSDQDIWVLLQGSYIAAGKRSTNDDLVGLTDLSFINPWHAAMKLFRSATEVEELEDDEFSQGPRVAQVLDRRIPLQDHLETR